VNGVATSNNPCVVVVMPARFNRESKMKTATLPTEKKPSDLPQTPSEFVRAFGQLALSFQDFEATLNRRSAESKFCTESTFIKRAGELIHAAMKAGLMRRYCELTPLAAFHFGKGDHPGKVPPQYVRGSHNFLGEARHVIESERPEEFIGKPADENGRLSAMFALLARDISSGAVGSPKSTVSDTDANLLQAMIELGATSKGRRQSAIKIVQRGISPHIGAESYKPNLSALKKRGYCDSSLGRDGGTWITPAGKCALAAYNAEDNQ
jgi:hypothetical protein